MDFKESGIKDLEASLQNTEQEEQKGRRSGWFRAGAVGATMLAGLALGGCPPETTRNHSAEGPVIRVTQNLGIERTSEKQANPLHNLEIRSDYLDWTRINGTTRGNQHNGVDMGYAGDIVVAPADGIVRRSYFHPQNGHMVTLDHGKDPKTGNYALSILIHLGERFVEKCPYDVESAEAEKCPVIKRGESIGTVGRTGDYGGENFHLHWGLWLNETRGRKGWEHSDPKQYWGGREIPACFESGQQYQHWEFTHPIKCTPEQIKLNGIEGIMGQSSTRDAYAFQPGKASAN